MLRGVVRVVVRAVARVVARVVKMRVRSWVAFMVWVFCLKGIMGFNREQLGVSGGGVTGIYLSVPVHYVTHYSNWLRPNVEADHLGGVRPSPKYFSLRYRNQTLNTSGTFPFFS
jgi:hypothetical protein